MSVTVVGTSLVRMSMSFWVTRARFGGGDTAAATAQQAPLYTFYVLHVRDLTTCCRQLGVGGASQINRLVHVRLLFF